MKKIILFSVAGVFSCVIAMHGQNASMPMFQIFGASSGSIEGFSRQVVVGKPFSGTEERRSLQTLGDGTRIETNETNRLFRDDQGRTRIERLDGAIMIFDPVEGFTAELNPTTRVAVRSVRPVVRTPGEPIDSLLNLAAKHQAEFVARGGSGGRGPAGASDGLVPTLNISSSAGPLTIRAEYGAGSTAANLPAQMLNGVLAEGTRTTQTIPIGQIGNDRRITVVNERWFSSDLQMLVKSTSSDPRFGDTTYQLIDIVRAAPDPSLFQIPADYTIRK